MKILGGKFYNGTEEVAPTETPDVWICRREEDYPANAIPQSAAFDTCGMCQAVIVYNPARKVSAPKVCMQCAGIAPDPLPAGWTPYK